MNARGMFGNTGDELPGALFAEVIDLVGLPGEEPLTDDELHVVMRRIASLAGDCAYHTSDDQPAESCALVEADAYAASVRRTAEEDAARIRAEAEAYQDAALLKAARIQAEANRLCERIIARAEVEAGRIIAAAEAGAARQRLHVLLADGNSGRLTGMPDDRGHAGSQRGPDLQDPGKLHARSKRGRRREAAQYSLLLRRGQPAPRDEFEELHVRLARKSVEIRNCMRGWRIAENA